jgi:hypothetical protein
MEEDGVLGRLTHSARSVDVLVSVALVYSASYSPGWSAAARVTGTQTTCHGVGLAMREVVRRLVERRAAQFVMAASAGDQQMNPHPANRGGFPCGRADAGLASGRLRPTRCKRVSMGHLLGLVLEQGGGHKMISAQPGWAHCHGRGQARLCVYICRANSGQRVRHSSARLLHSVAPLSSALPGADW